MREEKRTHAPKGRECAPIASRSTGALRFRSGPLDVPTPAPTTRARGNLRIAVAHPQSFCYSLPHGLHAPQVSLARFQATRLVPRHAPLRGTGEKRAGRSEDGRRIRAHAPRGDRRTRRKEGLRGERGSSRRARLPAHAGPRARSVARGASAAASAGLLRRRVEGRRDHGGPLGSRVHEGPAALAAGLRLGNQNHAGGGGRLPPLRGRQSRGRARKARGEGAVGCAAHRRAPAPAGLLARRPRKRSSRLDRIRKRGAPRRGSPRSGTGLAARARSSSPPDGGARPRPRARGRGAGFARGFARRKARARRRDRRGRKRDPPRIPPGEPLLQAGGTPARRSLR